MTDLAALKVANEKRWTTAKLTRGPEFQKYAKIIFANKARYQEVERRTGVHWLFVAVSHYRESTLNFQAQLGQGDPINAVSTHVPAGRGPFKNFEDSAYDALVNCAPYAARLKDWTIGGILSNLERYNGLGYANKGIPSPYIWSGTNQYVKGKYVSDGVFDPDTVDAQLGCAGLILAIMALDPTVVFDDNVGEDLKPVDIRDAVWLQTSLNKLGASPKLIVDGIAGANTKNATRAYQLSKGLTVDGIAGKNTITSIEADLASGKVIVQIPVPPEIVLPPAGTKARTDLAPTFWGRVLDLFRPKET